MYVATRRAVRARVYRPVATAVASRLRFLSSSSGDILNIGGVRKQLSEPRHPELIPALVDVNVGQGVLRVLKWMLQKDVLGQDMFLIGPPGPFRRHVCMKFLQLTRREVEYVALSRDTTESDLKQRREISSGTAHYVDQAAVRAALHGRVLVLEGIEKAERNVLPVLNNLMENREMQLEDGRFLLNADRYDALVQEHSEAELRRWRLARVSRQFRVVALGLPVPPYSGNPLDPPLRSRFQAYDLQSATVPYQEQLEQLQHVAPQLSRQTLSDLLSFGLTVNCRHDEQQQQQQLKLPDFPLDLLPALAKSLNNVPEAEVGERLHCVYPSSLVLPADLQPSVSLVRRQFDLADPSDQPPRPMRVCHVTKQPSTCNTGSFAQVTLSVDAAERTFQVPCGNGAVSDSDDNNFVLTTYHERLLAQLVMSHATHDLCVVGPRGCGKSAIVRYMATMLGYDIEPVVLYQDMTSRDLLQQRDTCSDSGDTLWRNCALVEAAVHGKLALLDGIHRVHAGTLNVLHRLVHDRELQLYDGSRLLRHDHYDQLAANAGALSQHDMQARGLYRVHPSFRIVALAEPPTHGGSKGAWLTPELMSLFFYHHMRSITMQEEAELLVKRSGGVELDTRARDVLQVSHALRSSSDANLQSLAHCLSTRQLLRVCRRMAAFPGETAYHAIHKACLTRFLPPLTRQALDGVVHSAGILPDTTTSSSPVGSRVCHVHEGVLTIGTTSVPVSSASRRDHVSGHASAKVPRTLFYDIDQHVDVLEAILEDFSLGENILLVGNQGVGKNKLVDRFLQLIDRPREYIQLHRDTTVQTLTQQSTVRDGRIVHEDSALLRAVRLGHVLVVDEADKAATHTTCVLKTLVEDGEMVLSDGRRLRRHVTCDVSNVVPIHPSFQLIVLANRPGFPFLGNDFFAALGDLFSCHAIDNPSRESERVLLKQYGPDVPDESIDKLVNMFAELREMADQGGIAYPYSTREAVNIVKHLQCYGDDGLASAVGNVFDFDSYSGETRTTLLRVLHKHGVPVGASLDDVHLATQ